MCDQSLLAGSSSFQYGDWLRANPPNRKSTSVRPFGLRADRQVVPRDGRRSTGILDPPWVAATDHRLL